VFAFLQGYVDDENQLLELTLGCFHPMHAFAASLGIPFTFLVFPLYFLPMVKGIPRRFCNFSWPK
jgi:hypothetical protein